MSGSELAVLFIALGGFVFIAVWIFVVGMKYQWPDGKQTIVYTNDMVKLMLIDVPFPAGDFQLKLMINSCRDAVSACFKSWKLYYNSNPKDKFKTFCIYFVDDMDDRQRELWPNMESAKSISAYLITVKRKIGSDCPMVVVRNSKSIRRAIISKGDPIIHETLHTILGEYSVVGQDRNHKHDAWKTVFTNARGRYNAPKV